MLTRKTVLAVLVTALVCGMGTARAVESLWSLDDGIFASPEAWVTPEGKSSVPEHKPGEIIVKFKKDVADSLEEQLLAGKGIGSIKLSAALDELRRKYKVKKIEPLIKNFKAKRQRMEDLKKKDQAKLTKKERHLLKRLKRAPKGAKVPDLGRIYRIGLESGQSAPAALAKYKQNPDVEYAQLNYLQSLHLTPNDPNYYPEQWALHNDSQWYPVPGGGSKSGTTGCDANAPEAWDLNTGSSEVIVAVIDTGVDYNHLDLEDNMWENPNEIPDNGIDDDDNGYIDDIYGYDFDFSDDDRRPSDYYGHGTHCAGIIAADGNNGIDVTGINWTAKIMAVKIFPNAYEHVCFEGIVYAADNGAEVLSNSWGPRYRHPSAPVIEEAIDYAYALGCVIVFSAGNNNDDVGYYSPANHSKTIAVAATDSNDEKASFSNYGDLIDVSAPGVDILSLRGIGTDMYGNGEHLYPYGDANATMYICSGTSMACPYAAGLAALCLAENSNLKPEDVRMLMKFNATKLDDPNLGAGRIDAYETLNAIPPNFPEPNQATEPDPCDDANLVSINTYLNWTVDELASSHDVYLGTDFNDVNDANASSSTFLGNVVAPPFDPNTLGQNTTYYWRVDERNYSGCTKGVVWSFTTRNGSIIYVDADANDGGDGMSWSTAFKSLEDALAISVNDEIWVAEGTYAPDTNDRTEGFALGENTKLYGGFAGTESARSQRDPNLAVNITTLSGDINIPGDANDNSYHVITGNDNVIVDRFTIKGGNADHSYFPDNDGGGMLNFLVAAVTVTDCVFTENSVNYVGGGMYNGGTVGETIMSNCKFLENSSKIGSAGGMFNEYGFCIVENCTFIDNDANYYGGGMINYYSSPVISNCTFSGNTARYIAGGMWNRSWASPVIKNCLFTDNSADRGAGMSNFYFSNPKVTNCTFSSNSGTYGAGMSNALYSDPVLTNCIFWGNHPNEIENVSYSTPTFSYCDIEASGGSDNWDANLGTDGGGNIDEDPLFAEAEYGDLLDGTLAYWELNDGSGTTAVDTVGDFNGTLYGDPTWVGPLAGEYALDFDASGDGVYINGSSGTGSPLNIYDSNLTISAWVKTRSTGGTIVARAKPLYITYRLGISTDKAYINTYKQGPGHWILYTDSILDEDTWYHIVGVFDRGGDKGYVYVDGVKEAEGAMTTDPLSNDATTKIGCRNSTSDSPFNGVIDEAAIYDRLLTPKEIKRCYRNGLNGYGYFEVEYTDCHLKVESPCRNAGDPNGDYSGQIDIDGESRVLYSRVDIGADEVNNTIWYVDANGGSDSDDGSSWQDAFATIQKGIDSAIDGDIVEVNEGTYYESIDFDGKAITVRSIDPLDWSIVTSTVIDANGDDEAVEFHTSEGADSVLEGFKITGGDRRGIRCRTASPTIADCLITNNGSSSSEGGGMDNYEASPTVTNCVFHNNTAEDGGGMFNDESSPTVISCVFYDNTAEYGAGMYNDYDSVVEVINCLFYNNEADYDGGGIYNDDSSADIINCTFRYNEADSDDGGGVHNDDSDCNISNCIFWRNYADDDGDEIYNSYSTCTVSYCDIDDCGGSGAGWDPDLGTDGGGNIDVSPDFENTSDRDGADNIWGTCDDGLRIKSTSPCKDAGQDSLVPQDIDTDIKGSGRIINGTVDMGAYEYDPGC
jgi:subtilisin family serine protease